LSPARIGDTIILDAVVLKLGKNLAFTRADVYRKGDNTLLAYGMQSMALVKNWEQFDKGKI
jgi:acyl-coenzyme A thioesterase 13